MKPTMGLATVPFAFPDVPRGPNGKHNTGDAERP